MRADLPRRRLHALRRVRARRRQHAAESGRVWLPVVRAEDVRRARVWMGEYVVGGVGGCVGGADAVDFVEVGWAVEGEERLCGWLMVAGCRY
jgi:hypothetical protein